MKFKTYIAEVAFRKLGCVKVDWSDNPLRGDPGTYWILPPKVTVSDVYKALPSSMFTFVESDCPIYADFSFKEHRGDVYPCNSGICYK